MVFHTKITSVMEIAIAIVDGWGLFAEQKKNFPLKVEITLVLAT